MDIEQQYDKVYRYCYFRLHHRETAEDITQEAFLRCLRRTGSLDRHSLPLLYTIARNLCIDSYRRQQADALPEQLEAPDCTDSLLTSISVRSQLSALDTESQELLLLRYVNELPVSAICRITGLSRFAVYRKTQKALQQLQHHLNKEDFT